jgi:hypothetical protein
MLSRPLASLAKFRKFLAGGRESMAPSARHRKERVDLMIYEKQRQEILKDLGADPYVD